MKGLLPFEESFKINDCKYRLQAPESASILTTIAFLLDFHN